MTITYTDYITKLDSIFESAMLNYELETLAEAATDKEDSKQTEKKKNFIKVAIEAILKMIAAIRKKIKDFIFNSKKKFALKHGDYISKNEVNLLTNKDVKDLEAQLKKIFYEYKHDDREDYIDSLSGFSASVVIRAGKIIKHAQVKEHLNSIEYMETILEFFEKELKQQSDILKQDHKQLFIVTVAPNYIKKVLSIINNILVYAVKTVDTLIDETQNESVTLDSLNRVKTLLESVNEIDEQINALTES